MTTNQPVKFTQYLFPDGRREPVEIDRPEPIANKAALLRLRGFKFEIENNNGMIWMSASHHDDEKHIDRFCKNGPEVPKMVDEIIEEAYQRFGDQSLKREEDV